MLEILKEINNSYATIAGVVINTILIMVTVGIGVRQLNSITKARYAEILNNIFKDIHSLSSSKDRDRFFDLDLSDYDKVTYENRIFAEHIIDEYNKISYMYYRRMIPFEYLYEMYSGLFIEVFKCSEKYIYRKREESGATKYAIHLEKMYDKCLQRRKKRTSNPELNLRRSKRYDLLQK